VPKVGVVQDRFTARVAALAVATLVVAPSLVALLEHPASAAVRCRGLLVTRRGDNGSDTIRGTRGRDVIAGLGGRDLIAGFGGNDVLCGGPGDDLFFGGAGDDRMAGGPGIDAVSFNSPTADNGVRVDLGRDRATGEGSDRWTSIEGAAGSRGDDRLVGSKAKDIFLGLAGADEVRAGGGKDTVLGGPGDDTMDGGGGRDWISFFLYHYAIKVDLQKDIATGEGRDRIRSFENAEGANHYRWDIYGDVLEGDNGSNVLMGGRSWDTFSGRGGDDVLVGLRGKNEMAGGDGEDLLLGGPTYDSMSGGKGSDLLKGGAQADELGAYPVDDQRKANEDGADWILGNEGPDTLFGGNGNDVLWGGARNDRLLGEAGTDTVTYRRTRNPIEADLEARRIEGEGIDRLDEDALTTERIVGTLSADKIAGSEGADRILGLAGKDTIIGRGGDDHLDGGSQSDSLAGDLGLDTCLRGEEETGCEFPLPIEKPFLPRFTRLIGGKPSLRHSPFARSLANMGRALRSQARR
jgi:Ca2+-binding RTX toxin-like protein